MATYLPTFADWFAYQPRAFRRRYRTAKKLEQLRAAAIASGYCVAAPSRSTASWDY